MSRVFPFAILVVLASSVMACSLAERPPAEQEPVTERARLERGRYLVENVMLCFACHSEVNWDAPDAPVVAGTKGAGAPFPETVLPFPLNSPNITPDPETGAGSWTDTQFAGAIREGIGHDGRVLFPGMPYPFFHQLSDEDLAAVIAYLRSLPPVRHEVPKTPLPDELQQVLRPMPITAPVPPPDSSDPVKRGEYLATMGLCGDCHTPLDEHMQLIQELAFAGGRSLVGGWGEAASHNITPDPSGIAHYDEELFIKVLRTGNPGGRQLNPIMLWGYYRNMTDEDLKAIFAYLQSLKPVKHRVDNTETPTYCKLCRQTHGFGDRN